MAEGEKEATHSLRTEIQMLFNTEGVQNVAGDVDEISQKVYNLVDPVRGLTQAFKELNDSPIKNLVKTLENFSIDSVNVDASNLKKVLENKIATAITKSKIEFIGDEDTEKYPFKIPIGAAFWEKNQKNITEAMAKSFSNFVVDVDDIPPLDNRAILEEFQTKFNEQIVKLIKDEEVFSLYKPNKDGTKKYKYKQKFTIDESAVNEIMGAIEKEFVSVLSDPANIVLEDIPKLNIKSVGLKQAILKIQDSIGNIDSLLGVDTDVLKDLPNIEDKLVVFKNNLDKMIREINLLAAQLESITVGKATEEDIKQALKTINTLKENMIIQLNSWIEDIAVVIDSNLKVQPNLDKFKESINALNKYVETTFQRQLELFQEDVNKTLNSLNAKDDKADNDILNGKKIDITQSVIDVITENLTKREIPIELDTELVDGLMLEWAKNFNVDLNEELTELTDSILSGMKDVFDSIQIRTDLIINNTMKELDSIFDGKDNFFRIEDLKKSMNNIEAEMYTYIISTLTNTTIKTTEVNTPEFELPKSFNRDVQGIVDKNIREYIKKVTDEYKEIGVGADKEEIDKLVSKLNKQAAMLVNAVLREVNKTLSDIRAEFLNNSNDLVDSTKNLKKTFYNKTKALVLTFVDSVEDALNTAVLTEDNLGKMRKDVTDYIENTLSINNIHFKDTHSLDLDDVLDSIIAKIKLEVKAIVANWEPFTSATSSGGKSQVEKLLDKLTIQEEDIIGTHVTSNIDSFKQGKEYKFKQYDNAISLARNPSEEMSYPNINDFSGVMGKLKVEFKGKTLNYLNKEHREFLDNLWEQIRKDTGVDDYFTKIGGYSPDKFTKESGRLVAKAKLRFLNELRPYIDGIQNFTIDADPYHKKGVGFTQDGFYAPELQVLNTEALKILGANEFDFDREYQSVYKEAMNRLVDIFKQNQGQKPVLTRLARFEGNELNPVKSLVKEMVTEQASKGTYENEGDFKYIVKSASDYIMQKLKFSAKQLGEMAVGSVGEDARITRELSQSTMDALKGTSKEDIFSLDVSELSKEIQQTIQNIFLTEIQSIGDSIIADSSNWVEDSVLTLKKNIKEQIEDKITNVEIKSNNDVNFELDKVYEKALKKVEKAINDAINKMPIKLIGGGEDEGAVGLDLKTKKLQNNMNSLIQKIINEKAKQITAYGNQLVSGIDIDEESLAKLKNSVSNIVNNMIGEYAIVSDTMSSKMYSEEEISKLYTKLLNEFTESFSTILDSFLGSIEVAGKGQFSIATSKIHPKIKKAMADSQNMSVKDFVKAFPKINGEDAQQVLLQKNVKIITDAVNDLVHVSVRQVLTSYEDSIKQINIEPDGSLLEYIQDELAELQDAIISRAKKMVKDQFSYLTEEIKGMNIEARSMGYKPTKAFTEEVEKATGVPRTSTRNHSDAFEGILNSSNVKIENATMSGVDVAAQGLNINSTNAEIPSIDELRTNASSVIVDGKVVDLDVDNFPVDKIVTPIQNLLDSQLPFNADPNVTPYISTYLKDLTAEKFKPQNVFGRGYNPFDLNSIFFQNEVKSHKGLFEGITSNMARYFIVGYMMRLPIKAITDANKVAAELDYHLAKAKQDILIKDPQMTNTAQRVVYDQYKTNGEDVSFKKFKEDVNKEAANLRNIMDNEMSDYLLNISKAYYQEISDVGRYYSIASRKSKDPYEALTKTREIAKISAVEDDLDTDFAATGLEALSAQWGIKVGDLSRYTNMVLKTAMLSNTTVTDLLTTQRDTAAMFKSRLTGLGDEKAFATAMTLSSMFVEATGKSGREAGTFWRNVLQRPYVKDSRKFLEQASQMKGFEDLNPYYTNKDGERTQKDFLTMFSNILDTVIKVDDPSAMSILSEVFPIRTIGGAESVSALVGDLKTDLERSMGMLKEMGELDENATIDSVGTKEVIEKYAENILDVTDEDIGMYLAGLQDTTQFSVKGLQSQWQSTAYSVFRELKEETSSVMTYLTAILRSFEKNSDKLSEVISIFMKIGVGYLGKGVLNKLVRLGEKTPIKLTDVQKEMANKYFDLQTSERALSVRKEVLGGTLSEYQSKMADVDRAIYPVQEQRQQLQSFIQDTEGKGTLTYEDEYQLSRAYRQRDMYDDQLTKLRNNYNQLEKEVYKLSESYNDVEKSYSSTIGLGQFLKDSMGAKNVDEVKDSFANYIRNEGLYTQIAPLVLRGKLGHSDEQYKGLQARKSEIEDGMLSQQKDLLNRVNSSYQLTSPEDLESILGKDYGDTFYAMKHRVSKDTIEAMNKLVDYFGDDYIDMRKSFEKSHDELNTINAKLIDLNTERLEVERAIFEAERPLVTGHTKVGGGIVPITESKANQQKIEKYRKLLPAFGVNLDSFESGMDALAAMFKDGKLDINHYDTALKDIASQLGIADKDFDKFKLTVMNLNNEIKLGKKDIYEYIAALERASTKSGKINTTSIVNNPSVDKSSKTGGLSSEALGVGALALAGKKPAKLSLWDKLSSKFGATSIGIGLAKFGRKVGATKLGSLGKGIAVGLKGLVTKIPQIGLIYAAVSSVGSVIGGLTERSMTDAERMSLEADSLEKQINKATGWKINKGDSLLKKVGKWLGTGIGGVWSGVMNQINRFFGGTAPSFKDTMHIRKEAMKHPELSRNELGTQLKEIYDVELKRAKANYARQQEYLDKNPFVDPQTGKLRDENDPYLQKIPFEDLMEFMDKKMKDLNNTLAESDALFTKEKVELLVSGISNNSKEMRDAIKEHLNRNIAEMTRLVNEFKGYLPRLAPGTEAHTGMQMQILDLENKISESELQKFETDFSEFDEIMERYSRQSSLIQSKYDIKKYDAVLSGINKDSSAIRQIEKKMNEEQIKMMSSIQNKLETLRQSYADKPDQREKILIQIQQLEADKKRILADMKDKMGEGLSTFNLPSDIKPITYYEAMTKDNTHKNMTVRAGDATVNVNIDNMTGSDADIDRLGKAVSGAVAQAQKNFVRQFANDVKSGMGNGYYTWNSY